MKILRTLLSLLLCAALLLPGLCAAEPAPAMAGGWTNVLHEPQALPEEAQAAFSTATEQLAGAIYTPVALLSTQVVTGINYCILCQVTSAAPDAVPAWALVYIYADLHGGARVTNVYELYIPRHAQPPEEEKEIPTVPPTVPPEEDPEEEIPTVPPTVPPEEDPEEEIPAEPPLGEDPAEAAEGDVQYVLYLGTNDKDTNKPVFTQEEALEKAREILLAHFGGYTVMEARGGWIDGATEYREYTLVIYLSDTTEEQVHAAADELLETFRQSSVLIQKNPTKTEFYSPQP